MLTITRPMNERTGGSRHFVRIANHSRFLVDLEAPDRMSADRLTIALNNYAINFSIIEEKGE